VKGSRNYMGVDSPVVDELVNLVIQAPTREELVHRTRALDRVLLHGHYVIPNWYLAKDRIAYWSFLQRPETVPKNGVDINNWWVKSPLNGQLYPQAPCADNPHPPRDHAAQFRHCSGRPWRSR